jgi:hypothetical protein
VLRDLDSFSTKDLLLALIERIAWCDNMLYGGREELAALERAVVNEEFKLLVDSLPKLVSSTKAIVGPFWPWQNAGEAADWCKWVLSLCQKLPPLREIRAWNIRLFADRRSGVQPFFGPYPRPGEGPKIQVAELITRLNAAIRHCELYPNDVPIRRSFPQPEQPEQAAKPKPRGRPRKGG